MKVGRIARTVIVVAVVALVGVLLAILGASGREPSCEGKRLSAWLADLEYSPGVPVPKEDKAIAAVRQIGTNALPALLRMMGAVKPRPPFLDRVNHWLVMKLPGYRVVHEEPSPRRAMLGFYVLGPVAKPAVPELVYLLKHTNRFVRQYSAGALGGIGSGAKDAIKPLLVLACTGRFSEPFEAARAIARIGPDRPEFVPALVVLLNHDDPDVRLQSVTALGTMGRMASNSVPVLQTLLNYQHTFVGGDGGAAVRVAAQKALTEISASPGSAPSRREGDAPVTPLRNSTP